MIPLVNPGSSLLEKYEKQHKGQTPNENTDLDYYFFFSENTIAKAQNESMEEDWISESQNPASSCFRAKSQ